MAELTEEDVDLIDGLLRLYVEYVYDPEVENARRRYFNARTKALLLEQSKRGRFEVPLYNPDYPPEILELENNDAKRKQFEALIDDNDMRVLLPLFERADLYWDAALEKEKGRLAAIHKVLAQWAQEELQVGLPDPKYINFDPHIVDMLPSGKIHIGQQSRYDAAVRSHQVDQALDGLARMAAGPDLPGGGKGGGARRAGRRNAGRRGKGSRGSTSRGTGSKGTTSRGTNASGTRSTPIVRRTPSTRTSKSPSTQTTAPKTQAPKAPPPPPPKPREPPKGSKGGTWIELENGKSFWAEGRVEPTLKSTVHQPSPSSGVGNPKADSYERKVAGGKKTSVYVYTGGVNDNGSPKTVEFDYYRHAKGQPKDLQDAKFRMEPTGQSIYDPSRGKFNRKLLDWKVSKQENARRISGADTVTWIVSDKKLADQLRIYFESQGYSKAGNKGPFRVLHEKY